MLATAAATLPPIAAPVFPSTRFPATMNLASLQGGVVAEIIVLLLPDVIYGVLLSWRQLPPLLCSLLFHQPTDGSTQGCRRAGVSRGRARAATLLPATAVIVSNNRRLLPPLAPYSWVLNLLWTPWEGQNSGFSGLCLEPYRVHVWCEGRGTHRARGEEMRKL